MDVGNPESRDTEGPVESPAPPPPPRALTGADEEEVARIELQETGSPKPRSMRARMAGVIVSAPVRTRAPPGTVVSSTNWPACATH